MSEKQYGLSAEDVFQKIIFIGDTPRNWVARHTQHTSQDEKVKLVHMLMQLYEARIKIMNEWQAQQDATIVNFREKNPSPEELERRKLYEKYSLQTDLAYEFCQMMCNFLNQIEINGKKMAEIGEEDEYGMQTISLDNAREVMKNNPIPEDVEIFDSLNMGQLFNLGLI